MSKTILITRPKGDEYELTHELQTLGHHVIHEPITEILLDHTLRGEVQHLLMTDPAAIIITSKHAVQALALLTEIRDVYLLCVGEATADMAHSMGFTRVEAAGGDLERLIDYIRGAYDEDAHFVYISGAHIRSDLPLILQSFGYGCERLVAYEAVASLALSDTLVEQLKRGQIDAVTFFSARNARIFCELLKLADLGSATLLLDAVCLSEEVASSARACAWQKVLVADEPTLASLVECVDNSYD